MSFEPLPEHVERLAKHVLDAAFRVHKSLGPGLLESVYEHCLSLELQESNIPFVRQAILPITYNGKQVESGLRLDLHVDQSLVVELKAVEKLLPIHEAQLFTYLKLTGNRLGLMLNFNVVLLKDGIKRVVR